MFRNILVPTDGSRLSARAIKRAVKLAKEQKARVTAFYAGPEWTPHTYGDWLLIGPVTPAQHAEIVRNTAHRYFGVLKREAAAAGIACKCMYSLGDHPYREIIKAAKRNRSDLIVMASHGRRGISKLLLGSETTKVLAHSKIPVLVMR